jgi:uncharacterized membrane protein YccC
MARAYNERLLFFVVISLAALVLQAQRPTTSEGRKRAGQAMKAAEETLDQVRPEPATGQPDWEKARTDADRLLTLAQHIHAELHAGPGRIPATLAGELKQTQRLAKRIREQLQL